MRYFPHTDGEIASMLDLVEVKSLDDLFSSIPECCKKADLKLPDALSEWELDRMMDSLAGSMAVSPDYKIFIGAGSYDHHIPAVVPYILGRSEFTTSYTPYQSEMSQGTLQAIYEYQTLAARLMGMEIATASHYDGATALAEALLMAVRKTGKKKIVLSGLIHPFYRRVVQTYFKPAGYNILELPYTKEGLTDFSGLDRIDEAAAVAVQSPNFFGCIENLKSAGEKARNMEARFVVCFTEALAYGLLKSPGSLGADIVSGEGQSLGLPKSFGGPGLGMLGSRTEFMRSLPGRLVGRAKDRNGHDGFVLTLATREQHIRRERATSNICSNNSLCALAAVIYMSLLGGSGIMKLAKLNHDKASYLKKRLNKSGFKTPFKSPFFNEFVVKYPKGFNKTYKRLLNKKIVCGLSLAPYYPELADHYLLCATETILKEDIDLLVKEVAS